MTCPKCNQEHDDQACPDCTLEQVIDPNVVKPADDNLAATSSAPTDDSNNKQAKSANSGGVNLDDSKLTAGRDINFLLQAIVKADESHKGEEEKSLWDFVKSLSRRSERHYRPSQADLQEMVATLIEDHIILI